METLIGQNHNTPASSANLVVDGDQKTFIRDVMDASKTVPVLVDFWASWCAPCKQLTLLLEKLVRAAGGRIRLVKIDIEKNRALTQQLAAIGLPIQSVPTVAAFWKGQIVDLIQGALPESELKQFIQDVLKLAGGALPGVDLLESAKTAQQEGQFAAALELFSALLSAEPDHPEAWGGAARCLIALDRTDDASALLKQAPDSIAAHPALAGARSALAVAAEGRKAITRVAALEARLRANPSDHDARFDLASALNASGMREEAANALLEIVRTDRAWRDDGARLQLLTFFDAWGLDDPASVRARRKLSALLFR